MSPRQEPSGRARGWVLVLLLVLALGAGGFFLGRSAPDVPPPPVAAPVAPAPEPVVEVAPRARVVEVVGAVERTRGEAWMELRVGDSLAPDEAVRTGPGARVDLQVGDEASRLSIPERSEVRVGELTRDVHTLNLERGRIDVDYGESQARVLRVRSPGGTVAETRAARFTMLRRGTMVAVVTRGGTVDLSSAGARIQVGAGQQGIVFDGARPVGPEPIPLDVLLKVARAPTANTLCLSLSGKVRVGTEVWVEDEPAEVSADGSFHADVPQAPGRSRVKVFAREPGGATREVSLTCRFRPTAGPPPSESVKFRWNEAP
ncbi:FecR domain-containing protein [Cystobacter fuscus]|uniref:FecR domain-containing protein n=1 Tax=Cystobacter fuscus TaxID=43 RepID=UPI002B321F64|nr:FecR domain-containing protein [Cystobacter fuscus]